MAGGRVPSPLDVVLLPVLFILGAVSFRHRGRLATVGWVFVAFFFLFYLSVILWVLIHQPPPD
jgi:uncharacterized PurR-regulated membrane protein YhhQ (DUF165 family)